MITSVPQKNIPSTIVYYYSAAPYPVRPARPRPYLDFEKQKKAAAARHHYRGLTWLGRARPAGGAPDLDTLKSKETCNVYKSDFY